MFCAAFRRFVWCKRRVLVVGLLKLARGSKFSTLKGTPIWRSPCFNSKPYFNPATQFSVSANMPPRGKAKPKKESENGKERRVRESRNVKAKSYKDLSDSDDDKPISKRKKESESESVSEEEQPKRGRPKGRRAPARSRKEEVSDSEEASDSGSSDESSGGDSRKRRKPARKPTRSLRAPPKASYKDLSNSEEDSKEDEDSNSEEEKSPPKRKATQGKASKSPKKLKKDESSEEEEEEEEEEVEDEEEDEVEDEEEENEKEEKTKPKPEKPVASETSTASGEKAKEKVAEKSPKKKEEKPRPEHELSDEDEGEEGEEGDDEAAEKEEEKAAKKDKDVKAPKKDKDAKDSDQNASNLEKDESDAKKRGRAGKASENTADNESDEEPPAKKVKAGDKPMLNKTDSDYTSIDFTSNAKTKEGNPWNFKISSWNVAGLKAWIKKNGLDFIKHENPDVLCLQETKCSEKKLPPEAKVEGYHTFWLTGEKEGYAGVAIYSKTKPLDVKYGVGKPEFDNEGRVITAEYEKFFIVNTYVPNAGQGLKSLPRRLEWDPTFRAYLKTLDEKKPVILCGDLNVAHEEIDLANPKTNTKSAGFTPQEREGMTGLLKEGFVDTYRNLYPDKTGAYSFWTYMSNARSRNVGWRLDYFITSERFLPNVCDNVMRSEVFGSDHCPITLFAHV